MNGPTADFITSTLSGAIAADATTITIGTGVSIPSTNGALQIDYDSSEAVGAADGPETITYATYNTATGVLGGVTRGAAGTTGVTHQNGASVSCGPTSLYFQIDASWNSIIVDPTKGTGSTLVFADIDLTGVLSVGDKIKYTDTTVKYGYVTAISFSTDTTITITGGSDYTLVADPTAGTFYYSKSSSPVGFPGEFTISANTTFRMEGRTAIVEGWGYQVGDGSGVYAKSITHGFNFGSVPDKIQATGLGRNSSSDPDSVDDFVDSAATCMTTRSITATSFILFIWGVGVSYTSSDRLGYSFSVSKKL